MPESALSLVERLRAALDRAEEIARAAAEKAPPPWTAVSEPWEKDAAYLKDANGGQEGDSCGCCSTGTLSPAVAAHAAANDPAHVLRTVAAHRKIVHDFETLALDRRRQTDAAMHLQFNTLRHVVEALAAVYFPEAPDGT